MEEVSIMPLMSGFPFMFTLSSDSAVVASSVSNYSFSLFSRGLSTNAIKIPNLSIKDCNTYESNVVHALWSGNSKHLLQNMGNLLKSETWINTKSNINYVRSSHNNLGTGKSYDKMVYDNLLKGLKFGNCEVNSLADCQEITKHLLKFYNINGEIKENNIYNYILLEETRQGLLTPENKLCASQLGGRLGGTAISKFHLERALNEIPHLLELSHRSGSLFQVRRPDEMFGDWCIVDTSGHVLSITEAKTYNNLLKTSPLEHLSEHDFTVLMKNQKSLKAILQEVLADGRLSKLSFDMWSKGMIINKDTELLLYVANPMSDITSTTRFKIPYTDDKTFLLNVRSLENIKPLTDNLLSDIKSLTINQYDLSEQNMYMQFKDNFKSKSPALLEHKNNPDRIRNQINKL